MKIKSCVKINIVLCDTTQHTQRHGRLWSDTKEWHQHPRCDNTQRRGISIVHLSRLQLTQTADNKLVQLTQTNRQQVRRLQTRCFFLTLF